MAIVIAMVFIAVSFSYSRLSFGIPAVGTCSWAISAACHDIGGESDAAEKPLMWVAVYQGDNTQPGHCTITSRNVVELIVRQIYE